MASIGCRLATYSSAPQFSGDAKALRFAANPAVGGPGAYYQTISTGFEAGMPTKEIHDGMEIYREYRDANGER